MFSCYASGPQDEAVVSQSRPPGDATRPPSSRPQPPEGWTTASVEVLPRFDVSLDPTPGLVLIYSRLHAQLPSALAFASDVTTLGRESDNSLSIPEAAVSRYHARIERKQDGCFIIDNGSTNGTIVNGERVEARNLAEHDVVRIGDTIFRFAARGVYAYSAYRIDGTVLTAARPVRHGVRDPLLVGGYQLDLMLEQIEKVACTELAVIVTGESGTGKELVAREVHRLSGRRGPFQAINCAALPGNLIESELFGYRRGAFSGATQDKLGLVKAAHGGTLFLDEIGDMPMEAQAKLLRVIQEKEVLPLGSTTPERIDVRFVCATHRDLEQHIAAGKFRGDLLARLGEFWAELPPLRERREDVYALVLHFLRRAGHPHARVTFPYMLGIAHYDWPYNVRELESAVKLSVALAQGADLDLMHLPETVRKALEGHGDRAQPSLARTPGDTTPAPARTGVAPTEQELRALLSRHRGNIAAVGRDLGKERMQVHRWLKRYAIDVNDYRSDE